MEKTTATAALLSDLRRARSSPISVERRRRPQCLPSLSNFFFFFGLSSSSALIFAGKGPAMVRRHGWQLPPQALIVKERRANDELQEARKALIKVVGEMLSNIGFIGKKRMGELDDQKPFPCSSDFFILSSDYSGYSGPFFSGGRTPSPQFYDLSF